MAAEVRNLGKAPVQERDEEWTGGAVRNGIPLLEGFTSETLLRTQGSNILCVNEIFRNENQELRFRITTSDGFGKGESYESFTVAWDTFTSLTSDDEKLAKRAKLAPSARKKLALQFWKLEQNRTTLLAIYNQTHPPQSSMNASLEEALSKISTLEAQNVAQKEEIERLQAGFFFFLLQGFLVQFLLSHRLFFFFFFFFLLFFLFRIGGREGA